VAAQRRRRLVARGRKRPLRNTWSRYGFAQAVRYGEALIVILDRQRGRSDSVQRQTLSQGDMLSPRLSPQYRRAVRRATPA
jgi:hypothetical protein